MTRDENAVDEQPTRTSGGEGEDALARLAGRHATGYRSVGVMAYDIIREAILDGTLPPGHKLRQETLAESIGVSRLPVRSALIQLESDGLVEFHDRRGAVVKSLSVEQAREVYHLRILLETEALRSSMGEMSDARLERLRMLGRTADAEQEGADFVEARTAFYAELYDATRRPIQWELIDQLRLKVGRYMLGWRLVGDDAHQHSHDELTDAVAAGDADAAVELLRHHLEGVRDGVLDMLAAESTAGPAPATGRRRSGR
ncbi:GntR family transcriptional regulator [Agromyces marinus]|uniref:GntR family transcriptional regulator n=1 Tax=Agromyces marinus TaxID=1389020 RepID=A0ABM8H2I3_9MICO|nr:GntR family transcriptional regulator [Agromyces marinus]BDZ55004.1 GntR family transcriptional regulator [Agromyces marinus]